MTKFERFFDKVICDYNCGDIRLLLSDNTTALGPLLSAVMAGVDTVAGMMFGFADNFGKGNSRVRSVRFLKDNMKCDGVSADAIYSCARCGYLHEGLGKLNVSFFADYKRVKPGTILYRRKDGKVALNVFELAYSYLDAIEQVSNDLRGFLQYLPTASKKDEDIITSLLAASLPNLEDFDGTFVASDMRGSHCQDDISEEVHYWDYDGYDQNEVDA